MAAERVLVVAERCLGDSVHTLPLLETLESRWPNLWVIGHGPRSFVLDGPGRTFITEEPGRSLQSDLRRAATLRAYRFDVAVVAKASFRSAWITRLTGIRRRVGHAREGRSILLTDTVPYQAGAYEAFCVQDLARPLGITVRLQRPRLQVPTEFLESREKLEGATIAVQPGATGSDRVITTSALAGVVRHLQSEGIKVALVGGVREAEFSNALCKQLDAPVVNLIGKTTLPELMGVLSGLELILGPDSGLMHLAAALGTTTVQAFASATYKKWGNAFGANQVVVAPRGKMEEITSDILLQAIESAVTSRKLMERVSLAAAV
jgi:heptosyltransferase I